MDDDNHGGTVVETEALAALNFYQGNYDQLFFMSVAPRNGGKTLGNKPFKCRFCDGEPPHRTFRKRAHAVPELLGNKLIKTLYECDDCNDRFSSFEDDLAKMTLADRTCGVVVGKNGVPTLVSRTGKTRLEFTSKGFRISQVAQDEAFILNAAQGIFSIEYNTQPYRPLGAYKSLCKSALSLLPPEEVMHFSELRRWLLEPDVLTRRVYSKGTNLCLQTFVPAFRPFQQTIIALHRRKADILAPYVSFFVAFGNISFQIFPPCPSKDTALVTKPVQLVRYPHLYQLQPWLAKDAIQAGGRDLSSPDRSGQIGVSRWHFDQMLELVKES